MLPAFSRSLLCCALATMSLAAVAAPAAPAAPTAPAKPAAPAGPNAAAAASTPQARSMDVLRAFDKLCNAPQLTFDVLSARARATGMTAVPNPAPAAASGTRVGRWGGALPNGEFALLVDEGRTVKGVATSCAVAAEVGDADVFRATAIKTMSLRTGVKPDTTTEGERTYDFGIVRAPSTRITIRDLKLKGLNRILVSVSSLAPVPAR